MSRTKIAVLGVFVSAALSVGGGVSAQTKPTGSGPNPFADCGIGAALFSETKWAAVTSNVIWDIGTTAVISATASPETCSGKQVAAALFVRDTYDKLVEEAAIGTGEHLISVLSILECSHKHHDAAIVKVRSGMADVVAKPGYVNQSRIEKASDLYNIVDRAVSSSCSV